MPEHAFRVRWDRRQDGPPRHYLGEDHGGHSYRIERSTRPASPSEDSAQNIARVAEVWRLAVDRAPAGDFDTVTVAKEAAQVACDLLNSKDAAPGHQRFVGQEVWCPRYGVRATVTGVNVAQSLVKARYAEPLPPDVRHGAAVHFYAQPALTDDLETKHWVPALSFLAFTDSAPTRYADLERLIHSFVLGATAGFPLTPAQEEEVHALAARATVGEVVAKARELSAFNAWARDLRALDASVPEDWAYARFLAGLTPAQVVASMTEVTP